jgi:tetratricopeptide (TPR) repeat protein
MLLVGVAVALQALSSGSARAVEVVPEAAAFEVVPEPVSCEALAGLMNARLVGLARPVYAALRREDPASCRELRPERLDVWRARATTLIQRGERRKRLDDRLGAFNSYLAALRVDRSRRVAVLNLRRFLFIRPRNFCERARRLLRTTNDREPILVLPRQAQALHEAAAKAGKECSQRDRSRASQYARAADLALERGRAFQIAGDRRRARRAFVTALSLDPSTDDARNRYAAVTSSESGEPWYVQLRNWATTFWDAAAAAGLTLLIIPLVLGLVVLLTHLIPPLKRALERREPSGFAPWFGGTRVVFEKVDSADGAGADVGSLIRAALNDSARRDPLNPSALPTPGTSQPQAGLLPVYAAAPQIDQGITELADALKDVRGGPLVAFLLRSASWLVPGRVWTVTGRALPHHPHFGVGLWLGVSEPASRLRRSAVLWAGTYDPDWSSDRENRATEADYYALALPAALWLAAQLRTREVSQPLSLLGTDDWHSFVLSYIGAQWLRPVPNYKRAACLLKRSVERDSRNHYALVNLGVAQNNLNEAAEAEANFREARRQAAASSKPTARPASWIMGTLRLSILLINRAAEDSVQRTRLDPPLIASGESLQLCRQLVIEVSSQLLSGASELPSGIDAVAAPDAQASFLEDMEMQGVLLLASAEALVGPPTQDVQTSAITRAELVHLAEETTVDEVDLVKGYLGLTVATLDRWQGLDRPYAAYNAACYFALRGDEDEMALHLLEAAVERDPRRADRAWMDPCFARLRRHRAQAFRAAAGARPSTT